jgi:hypothetical protein
LPPHWDPSDYRKRAKAWREKAVSQFADQRERVLCLDLAEGFERIADQLELQFKLERNEDF